MALDPPGHTRRRAVDGERLVAAAVSFSRDLRAAGLAVDIGAAIDFARALDLVRIADREEVRDAGAAVFVRRREDRAVFEAVFGRFWRARPPHAGPEMEPPTAIVDERDPEPREGQERAPSEGLGRDAGAVAPPAADRRELAGSGPESFDALVISPHAWSHETVDRHRRFDRMTGAEVRDAERFIDLLAPRLELRRTRRRELDLSDGWDRGDAALVARETARLRRSCHRLIWLNPLAGEPGYRPLAGGMAAALPSIDDFVAAGTLASLERLALLLGGPRGSRRTAEPALSAGRPSPPGRIDRAAPHSWPAPELEAQA